MTRISHTLDLSWKFNQHFLSDGRRVYKMSLIFRGKPEGYGCDDAMKFLAQGRETIVLTFKDQTTNEAHKLWGIKQ
jgi:hypothetical protein